MFQIFFPPTKRHTSSGLASLLIADGMGEIRSFCARDTQSERARDEQAFCVRDHCSVSGVLPTTHQWTNPFIEYWTLFTLGGDPSIFDEGIFRTWGMQM